MAVKFFNPKNAGKASIRHASNPSMKSTKLSVKKSPSMKIKITKPKVGKASKIKI